jgi:hypothetical protein
MRMQVRNEWFEAYAAAMLEGDQHRVAERVKNAQYAIESRLAKIGAGEEATGREQLELKDALKHLRILSVLPAV